MSIAAVAVEAPPSQFAALLRRSKFASYDRRIFQVYTAYGGDAHRGNYGFKANIKPRNKGLPVIVRDINSPNNQAEWQPAAQEARWVTRWELLPPPRPKGGSWERTLGPQSFHAPIDSTFTPQPDTPKIPASGQEYDASTNTALDEAERVLEVIRRLDLAGAADADPTSELGAGRVQAVNHVMTIATRLAVDLAQSRAALATTHVENYHSMSPERFERYIRRLARLRPAFQRFIRQRSRMYAVVRQAEILDGVQGQRNTTLADNLWDASTERNATLSQSLFLAARSRQQQSGATGSLVIAGRPHHAAGLTYSPPQPLTDFFLTKPQPGRYGNTKGKILKARALFAGMRVSFDQGKGRNEQAMRENSEVAKFRISETALYAVPRVGLLGTSFGARAVDERTIKDSRKSRPRPGTRESAAYDAHRVRNMQNAQMHAPLTFSPLAAAVPVKSRPRRQAKDLSSELEAMIPDQEQTNREILNVLKHLVPGKSTSD